MKLVKKLNKHLTALVLALMLVAMPTMAAENNLVEPSGAQSAQNKEEGRLQDDFYAVINKEWLESAKIKPGYTCMSAGIELDDKCREQLKALFNEILENEDQYAADSTEKKMINLYKNYLNKEARNKLGIEPIKPYLEKIRAIKTMDDLDALLSDIIQINNSGLYGFGISADLKDSNKKAFYMASTGLILGNADYYNKPNEQAKMIESATTNYLIKMLKLVGYSEAEASQKVQDVYAFEKLFTDSIIGQEEYTQTENIYDKIYNEYTLEQLDQLAPNLKLKNKLQSNFGDKVTRVIVQEPKWAEKFNQVYTKEHIEEIKNYIEIHYLCSTVGLLSEDFDKISEEYAAELAGVEGSIPDEQEAMQVINSVFSDAIGKLYVEKYFSASAKSDVEALVKEIIATYKKKLEAVDWMTEETKENAIKKLDAIKIKVGYPEQWESYEGLEIKSFEEGSSLFENNLNLTKWSYAQAVEELNKPIDKSIFVMSPQTVNACYNPTSNDITFPAAILQAPYYDVNRSKEENLGAIGAVIAHEISHAFDTSGAHFDENGNVKNWWTEEDFTKFSEKEKKVRAFYNNVTTDSGEKINGDLTVGENIADITAMSCMLDIMREMDNPDYKAFFESWATVWRNIMTPEAATLNLQTDVHSPGKIRANMVVAQFQEFYDTYDVKEGDGMYIKPEDRLKIY